MLNPTTVARRFLLWTVICCVSAAPSFAWAAQEYNRAAMVVGVALFILGYTAFTSTARFQRFHDLPFIRRTLYIGYATRLALSLAFPVGAAADLLPGMVSLNIVQSVGFEPSTFEGTLATTIVQGSLLNAILILFMSCVYVVQKLFMTPPAAPAGFEVILPAAPLAQAEPLR